MKRYAIQVSPNNIAKFSAVSRESRSFQQVYHSAIWKVISFDACSKTVGCVGKVRIETIFSNRHLLRQRQVR